MWFSCYIDGIEPYLYSYFRSTLANFIIGLHVDSAKSRDVFLSIFSALLDALLLRAQVFKETIILFFPFVYALRFIFLYSMQMIRSEPCILQVDESTLSDESEFFDLPDNLVQFRNNLVELLVDICHLLGSSLYLQKVLFSESCKMLF